MAKLPTYASRLFPPLRDGFRVKKAVGEVLRSRSQRLLLDNDLIYPCGDGRFAFLPMLERSLAKLIRIIDEELQTIGAQKLQLPLLTDSKLWEQSGRLTTMSEVLLSTVDRNKFRLLLPPTCEESITHMVAQVSHSALPVSHLPLLLYQIQPKFRDESHVRFGLLRCKEFLMKDLYSFDANEQKARLTYERMQDCYSRIFNDRLGLNAVCVSADCGDIGGSVSHEYHLNCKAGQDAILYCDKCNKGVNKEISADCNCESCSATLEPRQTVEIGHTFLLGQQYSNVFKANCTEGPSLPAIPMSMGCFGIGVTRLLAASMETTIDDNIVWPMSIAPYRLWVIPPKAGSNEEPTAAPLLRDFLDLVHSSASTISGDIFCDDRTHLTVGRRFQSAKRLGIPYVIIGNKSLAVEPDSIPKLELWIGKSNETRYMTIAETLEFLGNSATA